jgi:hypothetical protein
MIKKIGIKKIGASANIQTKFAIILFVERLFRAKSILSLICCSALNIIDFLKN